MYGLPRFHCLCGFSAGFLRDRIIPRGPQIAPLFSSVIYRTDTWVTLRTSASEMFGWARNANSICGFTCMRKAYTISIPLSTPLPL